MDAQKTINDLIIEHGPDTVLEAVANAIESYEGFEEVHEAITDFLEDDDDSENEESDDDDD